MDAVRTHYEREELVARIDKALEQHGLTNRVLTVEELAPIDHFHIRGIDATTDLARGLAPTSGDSVLDIGSGLGGPARYFARKFGNRVTGVDLTPSYVDAAKHLASLTGLSDLVRFDCGDALSLPYPDASFDMAMTQHVAMNIKDRERFYSEAYRVLKTGGKFALYDIIAGDGGEVVFPVPWADSSDTSFLLNEEALKAVLEKQKFKITSWKERTAEALEWISAMSKRQIEASDKSKLLGLNVILGPGFGPRASNLALSLKEGSARVLEAIAEK